MENIIPDSIIPSGYKY